MQYLTALVRRLRQFKVVSVVLLPLLLVSLITSFAVVHAAPKTVAQQSLPAVNLAQAIGTTQPVAPTPVQTTLSASTPVTNSNHSKPKAMTTASTKSVASPVHETVAPVSHPVSYPVSYPVSFPVSYPVSYVVSYPVSYRR